MKEPFQTLPPIIPNSSSVYSTGLILEGGGMRGLYTAGILDFFLERNVYLPYVIGVSAGACHAASYISRQWGRNKRVNIGYIQDPRYISYRNLIKTKSLFGMDFVFGELPNHLEPFDYPAFYQSDQSYFIGTTDCITGYPVYFDAKQSTPNVILKALMASSSLPFISPTVEIEGKVLLDGGIADPIPIRKSIADGNTKHVVILTRNEGYRKKPFKTKWLAKRFYAKYPEFTKAMINRHTVYNATLDLIEELVDAGKAFVIRPSEPLIVSRLERNPEKLTTLYNLGYKDAERIYESLQKFLFPSQRTKEKGHHSDLVL
jgi:predicted patatin/cPLA2 family phospholipase